MNKKRKKKANDDDDNSKYTHGNYNPGKLYVYHIDCHDTDKFSEYTQMGVHANGYL